MSIIDTLITDRSAADTAALDALFAKARAGSLTEEEKAILADPAHKGAYNYTDLNRVSTALEYLKARLDGYGYATPGYQRIEVPPRTVASSKLPEGYTQVEYIQSSGTQYIDTGFKPNQDTRVVVDIEATTSHTSKTILGARISYQNDDYTLWYTSDTSLQSDFGSSAYSLLTIDSILQRLVIDKNKNVVTCGSYSCTNTPNTFQSNYTMFLFGMNQGGRLDSRTIAAKLYSCQIYDNGTLIRDYVPVKDENGNVGLYDLVEGKFYGNAGSGAFASGAVVDPPVPSVPSDDETRDPFLWYEDDNPTPTQMAQYILNVVVIRGTLEVLSTTPAAPSDMEGLTVGEANAIEFILIDVETLINNMAAAWFYSGDLYSGEV